MKKQAKISIPSIPTAWKSTICDVCRLIGLPLLYIGVLVLAVCFFLGYTPNWILASAFALILIGACSYFYSLKGKTF